MTLFRVGISLMAIIIVGCAHPISQALRQNVDPNLTFAQIFQSPDAFIGKTVILGGEIVETRNYPDFAEIEVVQKPLDLAGYPESRDVSGGRFIFQKPGFVESEIFTKGRRIVGAGIVKGSESRPLDKIQYRYPVIEVAEWFLWEDLSYNYYYYPYGYYGFGHHYYSHRYYHHGHH